MISALTMDSAFGEHRQIQCYIDRGCETFETHGMSWEIQRIGQTRCKKSRVCRNFVKASRTAAECFERSKNRIIWHVVGKLYRPDHLGIGASQISHPSGSCIRGNCFLWSYFRQTQGIDVCQCLSGKSCFIGSKFCNIKIMQSCTWVQPSRSTWRDPGDVAWQALRSCCYSTNQRNMYCKNYGVLHLQFTIQLELKNKLMTPNLTRVFPHVRKTCSSQSRKQHVDSPLASHPPGRPPKDRILRSKTETSTCSVQLRLKKGM